MKTPFENDPFALVWMAFKNLYPDKDCICYFDVLENAEDGYEVFGQTQFQDDRTIYVFVDARLKITDATEIFAHELAHVAAGSNVHHEKPWQDAFDAIFKEYNRIGDEMFDQHDPVDAIDGKSCVRPEEYATEEFMLGQELGSEEDGSL